MSHTCEPHKCESVRRKKEDPVPSREEQRPRRPSFKLITLVVSPSLTSEGVRYLGQLTLVGDQGLDLNYHLCDSLRKVKEKLLVGICALLFKTTDLGKLRKELKGLRR